MMDCSAAVDCTALIGIFFGVQTETKARNRYLQAPLIASFS